MRKVSVVIAEKSDTKPIRQGMRKHQKVCFKFNYKITENFLSDLRNFDIKSLEMIRCIVEANIFVKMLESFPQLESLAIYTTFIKSFDEVKRDQLELPQMRKLKKLNMRSSDSGFLYLLQNAALENLWLIPNQEILWLSTKSFLNSHRNLEVIEYLRVLSVDVVLLTILTQDLKQLRRLHIDADCVQMSLVRGLRLQNTSVEHLTICNSTTEPGDYNFLLSIFKNVKTVAIEIKLDLHQANVVQMQQQWPKLESLIISLCAGDFFDYIQFDRLKFLKLNNVNCSADEWTRFARRNPSIEKILLKDETSMTNESFMTICTEFRNLKHFGVYYVPERLTLDILDFICDPLFPPNIKCLNILQLAKPPEIYLALTEQHKRLLSNRMGLQLLLH